MTNIIQFFSWLYSLIVNFYSTVWSFQTRLIAWVLLLVVDFMDGFMPAGLSSAVGTLSGLFLDCLTIANQWFPVFEVLAAFRLLFQCWLWAWTIRLVIYGIKWIPTMGGSK